MVVSMAERNWTILSSITESGHLINKFCETRNNQILNSSDSKCRTEKLNINKPTHLR